jgi:hypothetical protein
VGWGGHCGCGCRPLVVASVEGADYVDFGGTVERERGSVLEPGAARRCRETPARETRKEDNASLSLLTSPGHAAAEPGGRPDAGQDSAPGGGLDARYEELRHAALHARAQAFPLGLGVLAGKGVTAWHRALASLTAASAAAPSRLVPGKPAGHSAGLPAPVAAELISVLAAVALAGAGPGP